MIDIPNLVLAEPVTETGYASFQVDMKGIPLQAIDEQIKVQHLVTRESHRIGADLQGARESRLENYIVSALFENHDAVSYDHDADLLFELAAQVVEHLRQKKGDDEEVRKVLLSHQKTIAQIVFAQMEEKRWKRTVQQDTYVSRGYLRIATQALSADHDEEVRPFHEPLAEKRDIRGMVFGSFKRCMYDVQKFDSDDERRFAELLESDPTVLKWFKPAKNAFQIRYALDHHYEPDFVVETKTEKLLCEPKRPDMVDEARVVAKAEAAVSWCKHATEHEQRLGQTKPWRYVLIPGDAIKPSASLDGLVAKFSK
ncbi:MAG: hypothetical protein IPM79_01205 [Polyangiaceae bacterium]|nr:hypothetical protein [Polyangiaceae bacterium]